MAAQKAQYSKKAPTPHAPSKKNAPVQRCARTNAVCPATANRSTPPIISHMAGGAAGALGRLTMYPRKKMLPAAAPNHPMLNRRTSRRSPSGWEGSTRRTNKEGLIDWIFWVVNLREVSRKRVGKVKGGSPTSFLLMTQRALICSKLALFAN